MGGDIRGLGGRKGKIGRNNGDGRENSIRTKISDRLLYVFLTKSTYVCHTT